MNYRVDMFEVNSATIQINDHDLYYQTAGTKGKPAVVLLHHGLGSVGAWRAQMQALPQAGFYTIAYDRWGFGKSSPREALDLPYFETDQVDLLCLLDKLGLERASLVGHSDGGTLALYFAAGYPERVRCLVTIAAHIYVEEKMGPGIEGVRQAYESDERFRGALERVHGEMSEKVFYNWYGGWVKPEHLGWDMREVLGKVKCPVWVVQGIDDEHAIPQHAQDIASCLPNARVWLVPGAGHMLPQEHSHEFNAALVEFLNKNGVDD
jgi:pimeloyl-ACP methyl ester carboxylesterase